MVLPLVAPLKIGGSPAVSVVMSITIHVQGWTRKRDPLSWTSICRPSRPLPADSACERTPTFGSAGFAWRAFNITSAKACLSAARSPVMTMGVLPESYLSSAAFAGWYLQRSEEHTSELQSL